MSFAARRIKMPRKHHKPEEIVAKLRQVDVLTSQGKSVADAIRAIGVTEVTYYLHGGSPLASRFRTDRHGQLAAMIAVAVFGPTPLILAIRRQGSLSRKIRSIFLSKEAIRR